LFYMLQLPFTSFRVRKTSDYFAYVTRGSTSINDG
jgi:hypothetical protein